MTKRDVNFFVSVLLFLSLSFTGSTGLIAHKLDLHQFVFHKYSAYATLLLAATHVGLNFGLMVSYVKGKFFRKGYY